MMQYRYALLKGFRALSSNKARSLPVVSSFISSKAISSPAGIISTRKRFVSFTSVAGSSGKVDVSAQEIVRACDESKNLSEQEKCRVVYDILHPQDSDPQLTKMIAQAKKTIERLKLPCEIKKQTIYVHWPKEFSFDI